MHRAEQRLETDVLVIGGAAAGLTAALEARAQGVSVVVAAKSRAGRSGNTVVAGCQFCAVVPYPGSEDSPERHFQDSLAGGQEVNDEILLHLLTSRGGPSLLRLEEWGVRLLRSGGELVRRTPGGHSRARGIVTDNGQYSASVGGLSITLPLRSAAERAGVSFLDGVPILRLISSGGRVCGAVGIDVEKGELVHIRASAVIVAAGGAGHIYENTNNTRGISGDSYGLLLESGATLTDMEFVQFYPTQMTQPFKIAVASPLFGDGAVLRNRHGERFMPSYDPVREDRTTRDVMSRAIFSEVQRGNGVDGEVYMDCTRVPEGVLQEKYSTLVRDLRKQGVDPSRDWVKVGCTTHFFMGGARVDERCATGVPGLFAAGEAAGGVHGANRLAGNALTEAIVFGPIAGKAAGEYARLNPGGPESSVSSLELEGGLGGRESLDAVRADLRRAMWRDASIVRSDSSLRRALAEVRECAERVTRCPAADLAAVSRREETRLMALAAEAVVLSALARLESRGAHFREDYPSREDPWLGSHHLSLSEGRLQLRFVAKQPNRG